MTPILFIAFNRPDLTQRTFDTIRQAKPDRLFVAMDAPRDGHVGEAERTRQTRAITEDVDWDCEVTRLYADTNLGCGRRISSAITRVLEEYESAIILEDDCLPDPSFFSFCSLLLDHYQNDERVMSISGDNFQGDRQFGNGSYYFSKYPHCWGWATWRRAWRHFDLAMTAWPEFRDSGGLETFCHTEVEYDFWRHTYDVTHAGQIDTWDTQWTLSSWLQNGLTALPNKNLVSNIGFRGDGTHTTHTAEYADLPRTTLGPIVHPKQVHANTIADQHTDRLLYSGPWQRGVARERKVWRRIRRGVRRRFESAA
ncbi:MAG: glycosyltransferase family 2 protein [Planctomycetota bacterium]